MLCNTREKIPEYHHSDDFPLLKLLELTEQQEEQIRSFRHNYKLEMIDLRADIAKLRLEIREALHNHNFREAKQLNDQLYLKKGEMAKKSIELRESIHQVLTPEQIEQLKQLPAKTERRRKEAKQE